MKPRTIILIFLAGALFSQLEHHSHALMRHGLNYALFALFMWLVFKAFGRTRHEVRKREPEYTDEQVIHLLPKHRDPELTIKLKEKMKELA